MALLSGAASGQTTINVDFNTTDGSSPTYSGLGAAPDIGTTWNGLGIGAEAGGAINPSFTSGALLTSTGTASAVTVSLGSFKAYESDENFGTTTPAPALMTDFAYQQNLGPGGPDSTFSLANLNPSFTYDLYLYSQNGGYANTATIFTVNGISQTATNLGTPPPGFVLNENYVLFLGLVADGSGTISGTFNDVAAANNGAFNGLQLVEIVPEPTAVALLAFASLLTVRRRRS